MNKKLIALALAALPAAAMADVTIYGKIKAGFENVKTDGAASINSVTDLGSRIGFRGQEDLGNGLKAIWQVESGFGIDQQRPGVNYRSGTFASRQSFIGMESNFGKVRLGYLSNYGDSDMELLDIWEYDVRALGLWSFDGYNTNMGDGRYKNSIRYDSPVFAGFDFTYMHSFDETPGVSADFNNVGLGYSSGPLTAKYNYQRAKVLSTNKADDSQRVEATYALGNLLLGAGYSRNNMYSVADVKTMQHNAALTVSYSIGAFTPKFSYDHGWDLKTAGTTVKDTGYNQYIFGVDYALTRRTITGVSWGKINADKANTYHPSQRGVSVNMVHAF